MTANSSFGFRKARLLVVDDDRDAVDSEAEVLQECGFEVAGVTSAEEARIVLAEQFFDLLILDERMDRLSGSELLAESREQYPGISAIFLTGHSDLRFAVKVMQMGALDVLEKPLKPSALIDSVRRALETSQRVREERFRQYYSPKPKATAEIVGNSSALQVCLEQVHRVSQTNLPVLIQGESGTGKELVARAIHIQGPRSTKPFYALNCAALSGALVESELFGHRKGSFTGATEHRPGFFEAAEGGTLFLDEIGDISPDVQAKLLRVLQERKVVRVGERAERPVDVRVLVATNQELRKRMEAGAFRADLFYRLAVAIITLPPLRERIQDIPLLARHLVTKNNPVLNKDIWDIDEEALQRLSVYSWPGNVRELENVIQRAMMLATGNLLTADLLFQEERDQGSPCVSAASDIPFRAARHEFELEYFESLLARMKGNKSKVAEVAGMDRTTLYTHLRRLGLLTPE